MGVPKIIYCPKCFRKLGEYDGRTTINVAVICRNCRREIIYDVSSGATLSKRLEPRKTSSGVTFQ